ncbi:cupin domain-containing protein [Sphingobium sp. HBC34]|uniref:Cupin domain-containing protein n=1 Tax=Sphingobium cyanobacteriorum TaxID=3063954 RepID=A0ABT8ZTG3_9SPHN|nr:cupin domain-containing protein [Sphingobium sp. HBC34]MDO7836756.1 cupin domain-containing protein [Sphingobium sp. HBC34]
MTNATLIRSFIDLRAWAAGAPVTVGEGDPFLAARAQCPLANGPISVGLITLAQGAGMVAAMPADEFIIVESGAVRIAGGAIDLTLGEGDSLVLRAGAAFAWSADTDTRLLFMRRTGGPAGDGAIIPVDANAPLAPSGAPLAELLVGPTPECRNHSDWKSEDGEFMAGTWDSTPYYRRAMRYGHFELMYLLDGSVTFVDEAGAEGMFNRGDIFLVEQGASCSWDSQVHVKKVYCIYRPA